MEMTYNRVLILPTGFASDEPFVFQPTSFNTSMLTAIEQESIKRRMKKELHQGVVIAIGPECNEVKVGDVVAYKQQYITPVDLRDGEIKVMMREEFIEAVMITEI